MRAAVVSFLVLIVETSLVVATRAQSAPTPTIVRVQIDSPTSLKRGAGVRAHTVEPVFVESRLTVASGTPIEGRISDVSPASHKRRLDAKFHGDFTPLNDAKIQFDHFVLKDGERIAIVAAPAEQGAEVVRFLSANSKHVSLFRRAWLSLIGQKNQAVSTVKDPGKSYRLKRILYSRLPYHPQSLEPGSEYDVMLFQPPAARVTETSLSPREQEQRKIEQHTILHARLLSDINSAKAKPGDSVVAVVTEPKLNAQNQVEVPQGAVLRGTVLQANPSGKWGHNGILRFTFQKVEFPAGAPQLVTGVPSAVSAARGTTLQLDNEGGVKPQSTRNLLQPLALGLLSASALAEDEASMAHAATSSNGFGLIGRVVAISTGSRIVGGALGAVATGRSIYTHFLAHGKDVVFPRYTAIRVDVGPSSQPMPTTKEH